ncbi:metallophosphoesterase family protein [Pararhizobium mangrovi]|uniref:Serine/threonine protein phosphatase n=1 Tax=Pararhizobium mangrovi TaxID=2590452 RepID=A0A506U6B8_9HYPH|nr:metallophosphoesterase family protein [Pararhizobium mangrovi]TPW28149.1 serine/threonine protein phosphatase [Pararhizobium mangrovi]
MIRNLFRANAEAPVQEERAGRRRIQIEGADTIALYAVGDVHGCLDALKRLEERIIADARKFKGRKMIVMLGDYVDRGPDPAGVIEHLLQPPPEGFERICLAGNHEVCLLGFLDGELDLGSWLELGSGSTLSSYGVDPRGLPTSERKARTEVEAALPKAHLSFMRKLPVLAETDRIVCVHAGLQPGMPIEDHSDEDLVWLRPEGGDDFAFEKWVVHGHTPIDSVRREGRRINIDTAAFYTGRLTALRVWNRKVRILSNLD